MKLLVHPRMPFCAPTGKIIVECDYSGQELRIAAALSKDKVMTESYLAPEKVPDEEGNLHDNPTTDLHY